MRKKTILIEQYEVTRRGWILKLQSTIDNVRLAVIEAIRKSAKEHGAVVLNAKDPFGEEVRPRRRTGRQVPVAPAYTFPPPKTDV